jgi:hypothetical protein
MEVQVMLVVVILAEMLVVVVELEALLHLRPHLVLVGIIIGEQVLM